MQQFLTLLKISLGTSDTIPTISKEQWSKIFLEAQRQTVAGIMMTGIKKLPSDKQPPQNIMLKWLVTNTAVEQFTKIQQQKAAELTKIIKDLGFNSSVLKGVGIAQLYPNPLKRQGGDIDLWVDADRKKLLSELKQKYQIGKTCWHHTDVKIFDDIEVEIHFHPSWLYNPVYNKRLQRFFDSEKTDAMKEREIGYNYPSIEFQAIHSLAHTFHHLLEEGVGLRHILDSYYILQNLPEESRSKTIKIIKSVGLEKFLASMMYVLTEAFGMDKKYLLCEPNEKEGQFLLNEIYKTGNFGLNRNGEESKLNKIKRYFE